MNDDTAEQKAGQPGHAILVEQPSPTPTGVRSDGAHRRGSVSGARERSRPVTGVIGRPSPPAPPQVDQSVLTALHSALERADFTVERIEGALGTGQLSAVPGESAIHRRRLVADDPFSVLARLFVLGDPVGRGARGRRRSGRQRWRGWPQSDSSGATTRAFGRTSGSCRTVTTIWPPTLRRSRNPPIGWPESTHRPSRWQSWPCGGRSPQRWTSAPAAGSRRCSRRSIRPESLPPT